MYIQPEDYKIVLQGKDLDIITQSDDENRARAETTAIDQASGFINSRYDAKAAFAKTGTDRNRALLIAVLDIAAYHLFCALPGRMGLETRRKRYEDALDWLEMVSSGKTTPELPLINSETENLPIRYGGNVKTNPYY